MNKGIKDNEVMQGEIKPYDRFNPIETHQLKYKDLDIMRALGRNLGNTVILTEQLDPTRRDSRIVEKSYPLTVSMLKMIETKLVKTRIFQSDNSFFTNAVLVSIVVIDEEAEKINIEILGGAR